MSWARLQSEDLRIARIDAFDADDVMFDTNDTWGNNKKDKRAQFIIAMDLVRRSAIMATTLTVIRTTMLSAFVTFILTVPVSFAVHIPFDAKSVSFSSFRFR